MQEIHVKAPARVCLFGDHQDYLGLPVIACAIDRYITITASPNNSKHFNIELPDLIKSRSFKCNDNFEPLESRDYFGSSIRVLRRIGIKINKGYNISITGNIPINAGLSSSSALTVAWVTFLIKAFDSLSNYTAVQIGHLAYLAECIEHRESGGRMDQYTSAIGGTIHINTKADKSFKHLSVPTSELIIAESGVPKETVAGLANLNSKAHEALALIKKAYPYFDIGTVNSANYLQYDDLVIKELKSYYLAAFKNHNITQAALIELNNKVPDLKNLGILMYAHHLILKNHLKITTPEIDSLINTAMNNGAYGAKIVGSGGGGCIAVCAPKQDVQNIINALIEAGAKAAYSVSISQGAYALNS